MAEDGRVTNLLDEIVTVVRRGRGADKLGDVVDAADLFQLSVVHHVRGQHLRVHTVIVCGQFLYIMEDGLVGRLVEVLFGKLADDLVQRFRVLKHGPQQHLFGHVLVDWCGDAHLSLFSFSPVLV